MSEHVCRKCGKVLTIENQSLSQRKQHHNICKLCDSIRRKSINLALKLETLLEYGNKCVCCGEDKFQFLTIDHIDGYGAAHRKSLGFDYGTIKTTAGHTFYRWLKKNNYPKDNYQILCFNCNCAKHMYGECPHRNS